MAIITTIKTHLNSIISMDKARYYNLGIKDFYLKIELEEFDHVLIDVHLTLEEFNYEFKLQDIEKEKF